MVEIVLKDANIRGIVAIYCTEILGQRKPAGEKDISSAPTPETRVSIRGGRVGGDAQLDAEVILQLDLGPEG